MANPAGHVAVVGLSCRFPGAHDANEFWRNLLGGVDSITRVTGTQGVTARGLLHDGEWSDAGGDSLLLMLWEQLNEPTDRRLRATDLFQHHTVRAQVAFLASGA